jgi:hypothetical protein
LELDKALLSPRYHSHYNYFSFLSPSLFSLRLEGSGISYISLKEGGVVEPTPTTRKRTALCTLLPYYLIICRIIFKKGILDDKTII